MNFARIVIPFFGTMRKSAVLFLEGCRRNPEIDWIIFSDDTPPTSKLPENVEWVSCSLKDVQILAEKKLGRQVALDYAYKLCDYKPLYGAIFSDYLDDYEWWGYGDMDVCYGRIWDYLQTFPYNEYDKISMTGHFDLIRNTDACCWAFERSTNNSREISEVLANGSQNFGFDEWSFNKKFLACGLKIYSKLWAADIDSSYKRQRCVDMRTLEAIEIFAEEAPINYRNQVFLIDNGRAFRYWVKGKKVGRDEFAYIHFRKEAPVFVNSDADSYIVSRSGFYSVDTTKMQDPKYVMQLVKKYNSSNRLEERAREFYFYHMDNARLKKMIRFLAKGIKH